MSVYLFAVWDSQGVSDASIIKIESLILPDAIIGIRNWLKERELPETNYSLMLGV